MVFTFRGKKYKTTERTKEFFEKVGTVILIAAVIGLFMYVVWDFSQHPQDFVTSNYWRSVFSD